ncbi:MAG: type I-U CRISPR-associated protein Csx17 [Acidobacteriota bacterium]
MRNQILLRGCAPEPLIHYLKALGIFRLVSEQCFDAEVRGAWRGDAFALETEKTADELVAFFLNQYSPTPIVAPWNGGSGFYDGDDTSGREAIQASNSKRLENYRQVINQIMQFPELPSISHLNVREMIGLVEEATANSNDSRSEEWKDLVSVIRVQLSSLQDTTPLAEMTIDQLGAHKNELGDDEQTRARTLKELLGQVKKLRGALKKIGRVARKDTIVQACRNRLGDQTVSWIDAALVLSETNSESPLLGSGAIDGHLEFTKNLMGRLREVLPELIADAGRPRDIDKRTQQSEEQLRGALFLDRSARLVNAAVGQFHPAGAGGANASQGVSGGSFVNPWDFILAIEGTLVLASATVRQLAAGARSRASFPFTARNSAVGYGTAVGGEKMRAEIWLPLWSRLASFAEVAHIFGEGRVQFGGAQKRVARSGFDFARAVAELGVDRGIDAFQRYGFIERNGQANLAAPLGRFEVHERPSSALIYDVDRWIERLRGATRDAKRTPPRFVRARTSIEDAIFNLCASGEAEHLRATLVALGSAENDLARTPRFRDEQGLRPLAGLTERWAVECDDNSFEFELATGIASITGEGKRGPFRTNIEPVEITKAGINWTSDDAGAVWSTASLANNLAAVLHRCSIDARTAGASHPALSSKQFASLGAIDLFLRAETDDERIEELLRGLALIDWSAVTARSTGASIALPPSLPRAYALLKLLFLPDGELSRAPLGEPVTIRHEPSIVPLLRAGRITDALETAERRLRSSGLVPFSSQLHFPEDEGARLAAALLVPIGVRSVASLAALVLRPVVPG